MSLSLSKDPKPDVKDKPPSQKEMEDMMKEAQEEFDNMSEEDKKAMKEMGIALPSMTNVPQITVSLMSGHAPLSGKGILSGVNMSSW